MMSLNKFQLFGFIHTSLVRLATTETEIKKTLENLVLKTNDPDIIDICIDLLEFDGTKLSLLEQYNKIDLAKCTYSLSKSQRLALTGIAYKRGFKPYEHTPVLEKAAGLALLKHPEIEQLFREVFPFIEF